VSEVLWFRERGPESAADEVSASTATISTTRHFQAKVSNLTDGDHIVKLRTHRPDLQRWQPHPT
jgi:hypothetical protein